jgi:hypothetical protein
MLHKNQTFVLFRILGNDLPPRHDTGQALRNLRFILENEGELPGCEKRWVLNRLVDSNTEHEIIALLEASGLNYLHIPFHHDEYAALPYKQQCSRGSLWMSRQRRFRLNLHARRARLEYATNINGARNMALQEGHRSADWVLPWDGNCYVTKSAWDHIIEATAFSTAPYIVIPMTRVSQNSELLGDFAPLYTNEEPQLGFHKSSKARFSPQHLYGRRDKVELLWRLGVPGPWDQWEDDPWDLPRPATMVDQTDYICAGWVARLSSGRSDLEASTAQAAKARAAERAQATLAFLDSLDANSRDKFFTQ